MLITLRIELTMDKQYKHRLSLHHINIRSLFNKVNDVKMYLSLHKCDLLAVSETWLDAKIKTRDVNIDGYRFIRRDRGSRGGGVGLYISTSLKFVIIESTPNIEQLWVNIKYKTWEVVCAVIYKPPLNDCKAFFEELDVNFSNALVLSENIFCMGDFNINYLNQYSAGFGCLKQFMSDYSLNQLIGDYTRVTHDTSTLIDLILTTNTEVVLDSGVNSPDLSDHDAVFVILSMPRSPALFKNYRDFKNANSNKICSDLQNKELDKIYYIKDIDMKLKFLNDALIEVFDTHVPRRTIKITKVAAPWLSNDLKSLMKTRDKLKYKFKKTKSFSIWEEYKQLRNLITALVKQEKRAYFQNLYSHSNTRTLWKKMRDFNIGKLTANNDIPDCLSNVDSINKFFIEGIPPLHQNHTDLLKYFNNNTYHNLVDSQFNLTLINKEVILSIINKITTCASGIDDINSSMIKMSYPVIQNFLLHIINSCILENYFPEKWKIALIRPIPKSPDVKEYKDLRPISILPYMSKILEHVLNDQIKTYAKNNQILARHQSGFRAGHSCASALLKISDDILTELDRGNISILVLLDYSKAFDCLNHNVLMSMLHYYGFSNDAVRMIGSYFTDRLQMVRLGANISGPVELGRGVPQGSILGPLMFCIYTSQITNVVRYSHTHAYADDTQIYASFAKTDFGLALNKINLDLHNIYLESIKYDLILNPQKTKVMLFAGGNHYQDLLGEVRLSINGAILPVVEQAKNLGVIIDRSFAYSRHVSSCIQKSYAGLRQLYPHRYYLSHKLKANLCNALVLSHFSHCAPLYSQALNTHEVYRIQKVQNTCLRYIFNLRKFDHVSHKLRELEWLSMKNRHRLGTLSLYHFIITTQEPTYLFEKIQLRENAHSVNIRAKDTLTIPYHKTSLFEGSFSYCIAKLYNELPSNLKTLNIHTFKMHTRRWLYENQ